MYVIPLLAPQACPLHQDGCVCSSVCMPHLFHHPGLALCATGLLWASLRFPCLPSDRGHSLRAIYRLKSAAFSIFCPLSPWFAWFSEIPQFPLGPACEGASQCTGTLPVSGLLPSLGAQVPSRSSPCFPFLCLHSLSYLIPGRLAYTTGGLGSSVFAEVAL